MATLASLISAMRRVSQLDVETTLDAAHEAVLVFARRQVTSSGAYGGQPWAGYAGEPRYKSFKLALGAVAEPLRWIPGKERLVPALTDPRHPDHRWLKTQRGFALDITIPYVASIEAGGVGPFGERFPARAIFPASSAQLRRGVVEAVTRELHRDLTSAGLKVSA